MHLISCPGFFRRKKRSRKILFCCFLTVKCTTHKHYLPFSYTHAHAHTFSLCFSCSLTYTHEHSLYLSFPLSHTHTNTHADSLSVSLSLSLSHTHTHARTYPSSKKLSNLSICNVIMQIDPFSKQIVHIYSGKGTSASYNQF